MLADIDRTARRRERIVLALLVVLYYAVPWRALGVVSAWVGAPVVFALLVLAPGLALSRWARLRPRDGFERLTAVAMLGLAAALAACFAWALGGVSLDVFRYAFPAVVVALVLGSPPRRDARLPVDRVRTTSGERRAMWAVAVFVVAVAAVLWASGPTTYYTTDTIDHAAYVNEIERTQSPFPHTAFYRDPGPDGADLRKSLLHCLFGVFARHLGIGAIALFSFFGAAQLIILVLSVYTAALSMFGRRNVALVSALVFLLVYEGGIGGKGIRSTFYPNRFGLAPLLLLVAAATSTLKHEGRRERRRAYGACAVLGFTAAAVHIQFAVLAALAMAIVVIWRTCSPCATWGLHLRRSLAAGLSAGAAIAPYALYRYATSYQTNELHHQVQGAVFVAGRWFIADPWQLWDSFAWLGLASLVAIVPLWRRRREVPGVGFTIAALLTVLLIVVNPVVLPLVFDAISYLVFRLGRVVPHYMLVAFLVVAMFDARARGDAIVPLWRRWWYRLAAALAVIAVVVGVANDVRNRHILFATSPIERRVSIERWADGLAALSEQLPAGSVIASDPITSYYASGFTPHYVVCTLDQHAPPNDRRLESRMAAARDILSPYTSVAEKAVIMAEVGATHVVVNEDLPAGLVLQYWTLDPDLAASARETLEAHPDVFEKVLVAGAMSAFRWTGVVPADGAVALPVVAAAPEGARPLGEPSGEAVVVAAHLGAGRVTAEETVRVAAGDTVRVDLFWSREGPARPANYVVSIRFDLVGLELPMGGQPFPKIARKLKERIEGRLYRFRADHIIQRGFYSPDRWRPGAIVADPTTVRLPRDLAPGTYAVQAKLLALGAMPNRDLRSYFFDDDMYAGAEIGRIEVTAP